MTKIVAISDTHNQHKRVDLPEADILIHSGDATLRGMSYEWEDFKNWLTKIKSKFDYILFVPGNHDFNTKRYITDFDLKGFHYLEDKKIKLKGINFYGTPWMPIFHNWEFMTDEYELSKIYAKIPDNTEVLITHGPPATILDENLEGIYCGSSTLAQRVKELKKLKLHIFGHIHEGAGIANISNIIFANASQLNRWYELEHKPLVFDL